MLAICCHIVVGLLLSSNPPQAAEFLDHAVQEFRAGDYQSARQSLEPLLNSSPQNAPAHNLLGLILMKELKYQEAEREFHTVLRLQPESAAAHVNLGNVLVEENRDGEARQQFLQALSIHPEDPIALCAVGLIAARARNDGEAVRYLEAANRLQPANLKTVSALAGVYIGQKRFVEAEPLIDDLLHAGAATKPTLFSLALLALDNGSPQLGSKCITNDPGARAEYADASYRKAIQMADTKQYKGALAILLSAGEDPHQSAGYHDLLGTIYYQLDNPKQATDEFQKAIHADPTNPDHYFKLGMMFVKHRTADGAILVFNAGLKTQPKAANLWMGMGLSYYIQGDSNTAKEKLYRAITLDPTYGPSYIVLCDLLSQTYMTEELMKVLPQAIAVEPRNYLLPYYYGKALARTDPHAAEVQLHKSIAFNPNFAEAYFELGKNLDSGGDTSGAIDAFTRCLRLSPQMAEAHYLLFRLYHNLGKQELAVVQLNAFKQIRKQNGDDERIRRLIFTVTE
jgi:Tfp pilus assembly protein PilF